ncbi:MAG: hypothetical protein SPI30_02095 [Prevotella sp.]|nr:hypothetical protein [Prevotella sp.]
MLRKQAIGRKNINSRHRTNAWYGSYQPLVVTVPVIGTQRTNDW